ncbi:MAG: potassium channel family protein [Cyanobacteriota bacterium]|nr:potassium channel family protein [Cyanobacteriota bacterium]
MRLSAVRASFYDQLLGVCLALMACFALPYPWSRFSSFGYLLLAGVLIRGLGRSAADLPLPRRWRRGYPALGFTAVTFWLLWTFTPVQMRNTGIPVIVFWTVFGGWSTLLLIQMLARERQVNGAVMKGALAGYLMMGIAAGLLLCGLETIQPGSFRGIEMGHPFKEASTTIWGLNFAQLNYFAFVSLTTMGYGDVVPQTPTASMACVMIAVAGNFYIAVVMGLLISRLTTQDRMRDPDS